MNSLWHHSITITRIAMAALLLLLRPIIFVDAFALQFNPIATTSSSRLRMATLSPSEKHPHVLEKNSNKRGMTTLPSLEKHPHFVENNSDIRAFPMSSSVAAKWESIVPPADLVGSLFAGGGRHVRRGILGADVTVEFDDSIHGAKQLLEGCGIAGNDDAAYHLYQVLSFYQDIVSFKSGGKKRSCKARIVSSRGPIGTKCPRWHLDHVPVRLIMSLVGPGCVYIPERLSSGKERASGRDSPGVFVDREALNGLELDDTARANRIIVPSEEGAVHSAPGDAIVLMGREWDTTDDNATDAKEVLHAAAHKSPSLGLFEGRVLLTVDLAMDA